MFNSIDLIAIGRMKAKSIYFPAFQEYQKRLKSNLNIIEFEGQNQKDEIQKIQSKISPDAALIVLDEKGKSLSSVEFTKTIEGFDNKKLQIVIGGADGLNDDIRKNADLVLSFGKQTWPHMMARVMIIEQLYRTQQILANHPYHRE
jgi:23S rRNA (pseudouridine1915-N3)-methyltransferase